MSNTPDGSFPNEQSMSDHDESLVETEPEYTTTSSTASTAAKMSRELDLDSLSPRGEAIKLLLADEMSDGYNLTTLANELGLSPSSASALLAELRNELELQSGPLLPLSDEEYQALKESIEKDGVGVPLVIGEHGLIDGHHRMRAIRELKLQEYPVIFWPGRTEQQEHDMAIALNTLRRHLTREQKQALVRAELQRDWSRSSRMIASICGVTTPTVESVREKMRIEAETVPTAAEVEAVKEQVAAVYTPPPRDQDVRTTASGTQQQAYAENRGPQPQVEIERSLGYVNCGQCGRRHALYKDGNGYRLESV